MILNNVSTIMGRERKKVSDVCREAELARSTVEGLYKGNVKRVDFNTLDKLCKVLNCSTEDLIQYVPDNEEKPGQ